jgi:hypothetical protein
MGTGARKRIGDVAAMKDALNELANGAVRILPIDRNRNAAHGKAFEESEA